jgi:hypothetical protein
MRERGSAVATKPLKKPECVEAIKDGFLKEQHQNLVSRHDSQSNVGKDSSAIW